MSYWLCGSLSHRGSPVGVHVVQLIDGSAVSTVPLRVAGPATPFLLNVGDPHATVELLYLTAAEAVPLSY